MNNLFVIISSTLIITSSCIANNSYKNSEKESPTSSVESSIKDSGENIKDSSERMLDDKVYFRREFDSCGNRYLIQEYYPYYEPEAKSIDAVKINTIEYSDTAIAYTSGLGDRLEGNIKIDGDNYIYMSKFALNTVDSFYFVNAYFRYSDYLELTKNAPKSVVDFINRAKNQFLKPIIDSSGIAKVCRHSDWILRFKKEYLSEGVLLISDSNPDFSYLVKYPYPCSSAVGNTIDNYRVSQTILPPFLFNNGVDYYRMFGPINRKDIDRDLDKYIVDGIVRY